MEKKNISRKDFLTNTSKYAIGAVAGVAGLNMMANGKILAETNEATWPMPYQNIDPETARLKAHHLYWNDKDCCSGVFGAFTEILSDGIGAPWTGIPMEIMLFGRGGSVGWGSSCGTVNGGAAVISMCVDKASSESLINELWGWYASEMLPSDAANAATYEDVKYEGALPQNISGSPLCHVSVSQWCMMANKKVSDIERKERCARLAGDIAAKTAEILNAHLANTFVPTFSDSDEVQACLTCHGSTAMNNVMTHFECETCHGDPHGTSPVAEHGGNPRKYKLDQNYPNPFNPSTKIKFSLPKESNVKLAVYDIQGSLISTLIANRTYGSGSFSVNWDGMNDFGEKAASGIYFARIETENFMKTIKMNLVR